MTTDRVVCIEILEEAKAKLEEALALVKQVRLHRDWADAYIIPGIGDIIDHRVNRYNGSIDKWIDMIVEDMKDRDVE